ncbi:DNA-binding protein [Mesorhizobium sp. CO1-1-9]|uniref:DNA-binding protein n=1 Tax=Mesorhizobium sp. CO1-1-9 TaxID=2876630 RepID=UPI001CCBD1C4|nr:DNA-binding protein [Mesorhizobium sp. CO1-1-9]MBZ9695509.1 DNA-binding protein [Mesorhizobium sp. CO1-1-9]
MTTTDNPSIDLVWGAEAIATVIKAKPRQTFHLLETGQIPAKKVGGRWVAERGKLIRFFMDDEAA